MDKIGNPERPETSAGPGAAIEIDTRPVWNRERALKAAADAEDLILGALTAPGAPFPAEIVGEVLHGHAQLYHDRVEALERENRMVAVEIEELRAADDRDEGDERALERAVARSRNLLERRGAFGELRDAAAERYRAATGQSWRPRVENESGDDGGADGDGIPF